MSLILDPITTDDGHYFTIAEFRAFDSAAADFTDMQIDESRRWAEQRFEGAAHCAWVERTYTARRLIGNGALTISVPHYELRDVSAVTIDGVSVDLAGVVALKHRMVKRAAGWPLDSLIDITYTHGKVDPEDMELAKVAVMMLTGHRLVPSNLRQNATSESTDIGYYRIAHATPGGVTGLLEVDAVAKDHGYSGVNVG